jgi:hypothetical protein
MQALVLAPDEAMALAGFLLQALPVEDAGPSFAKEIAIGQPCGVGLMEASRLAAAKGGRMETFAAIAQLRGHMNRASPP